MTRKLIILSAVLWTVGAIWSEKEFLAFLSIATHAVIYLLHTIEVKVNKLLDQQGIYVTSKDFDA